jgi:cobalt-zinc-cadmium efflux system outer membrane protein
VARQCAQRNPNFEIGAAVKQDTATGFTVADVALGVPLPITNRNQGNILRAQADLTSARNEIRRVELELRDRLATAFEQYLNARRRAETYATTILPNARKALDLTVAGYREGEFAYLTMLTAERTYHDSTLKYLANLEDLWRHSVELEGMLLRGGLQRAGDQ